MHLLQITHKIHKKFCFKKKNKKKSNYPYIMLTSPLSSYRVFFFLSLHRGVLDIDAVLTRETPQQMEIHSMNTSETNRVILHAAMTSEA